MTKVALVGVGRWGKNLLRVLDARCDVAVCCNQSDPAVHTWLKEHYPHVRGTFHYDEVLRDRSIEAVVIATPIVTHAQLARQALEFGKHVFVEKPLATTIPDAKGLVDTATNKGLVLFVGHVFLFHPVLEKVKELTKKDPILYTRIVWTKFGTFGEDIFWDLVSHEVSIASDLFRGRSRQASVLHQKGVVTARDIVTVCLRFDGNRECLFDINRCAPTKSKSMTIVTVGGEVFLWGNDSLYRLRSGNTLELFYQGKQEPLALEADAFLRSVESGEPTHSDGSLGLMVVEVVSQLLAACSV